MIQGTESFIFKKILQYGKKQCEIVDFLIDKRKTPV